MAMQGSPVSWPRTSPTESTSSTTFSFIADDTERSDAFPAVLIVRNSKFYLEDGTVILRVRYEPWGETPEDHLFKVHRYFLERDSEVLRRILCLSPGKNGQDGMAEETAILLPDVTPVETECLLSFLYFGMYERDVPLVDWQALLSISSKFKFQKIRERAINEITTHHPPLDPVERLALAAKHDVPQWLKSAYVELCQRTRALSPLEAKRLGLETAMRLAGAREAVLQRRLERLDVMETAGVLPTEDISLIVSQVIEAEFFKERPKINIGSHSSSVHEVTNYGAPPPLPRRKRMKS
ncbi:uncharacterized protein LAESUDRAFT_724556 [Laetiporus sulphureus 93-53]|uniref:BTB domain-containing protein n=1 Tax=Laetiporus sulphureus 93-53 TaxID=1314785 RepID=A0A165ER70_9APHY|nr:uncharacterized protein LAESUDRAFT_724556 [Laetiporus sulphureus 93-53]KZT07596.1 hypothetical protein LAESUDRAFT_724556 [Laetiporus sulphureus 93-53]